MSDIGQVDLGLRRFLHTESTKHLPNINIETFQYMFQKLLFS